jgi:hypothetical protein
MHGDNAMEHHLDHKEVQSHHGTVRDIFGHRFVLTTVDGPVLANIGRHTPRAVRLTRGAKVKITGEQTASEIKVRLFQSGSSETIEILHKRKKRHPHGKDSGTAAALKVALDAGYIVEGEPKRKQKAFRAGGDPRWSSLQTPYHVEW